MQEINENIKNEEDESDSLYRVQGKIARPISRHSVLIHEIKNDRSAIS
jgi:hypothetical protein